MLYIYAKDFPDVDFDQKLHSITNGQVIKWDKVVFNHDAPFLKC